MRGNRARSSEQQSGSGDVHDTAVIRLDGGAATCDGGEGKDCLDFSILTQESNRGERPCSEDRKRKKIFTMGRGSFEVPEILGSMSRWKFGLTAQGKKAKTTKNFKNFHI